MYGFTPYGADVYAGAGGASNYLTTVTDAVAATTPTVDVRGVVASTTDAASATTPLLSHVAALLIDAMHASTVTTTKAAAHNALSDSAASTTAMLVAWANAITDHATATTPLSPGVIAALVDAIIASGQCASVVAAKNAIVEALFARTNMVRDWPNSVSDAAALADTLQSRLVTAVLLVDDALAQATLAGHVSITIPLHDTVNAPDILAHIISAKNFVTDSIVAVLSFQLDGDVFTGVVLNTESGNQDGSRAISEYAQFPFNSFTPWGFGGKYYGVAADGIYLLEGSSDNGEPIESYIRTGLIRVAGDVRSRVPYAYFGYTSTGDLVMKVVTTQHDGTKAENWYRLEPRVASAPHANRVKIGRGLSSVYWSFELHSISGSQFALDTIKLFPMPLERRV